MRCSKKARRPLAGPFVGLLVVVSSSVLSVAVLAAVASVVRQSKSSSVVAVVLAIGIAVVVVARVSVTDWCVANRELSGGILSTGFESTRTITHVESSQSFSQLVD